MDPDEQLTAAERRRLYEVECAVCGFTRAEHGGMFHVFDPPGPFDEE